MTDTLDIRWHQRFQNYRNALNRLSEAGDIVGAAISGFSPADSIQLLKEGLLQRFEFTQELAWKVMLNLVDDKC